MDVCWNKKRDVWIATGGAVGKKAAQTMTFKTCKTNSPQGCGTSNMTHSVLPCCGQLWCKASRATACREFKRDLRANVQDLNRVYREQIHWPHDSVGLSKHAVHLSMPWYVKKALTKFQHPDPKWPQHQLYPHVPPKYDQTQQFIKLNDNSPPLDKKTTKFTKELPAHSYSMPAPLIAQCSLPSVPLHHNKHN